MVQCVSTRLFAFFVVDNLQRCFIVPLYAFLWEGQNDPICDGSNFLSMYKNEMRSAFFDLVLFVQYLLWCQSVSNSSCMEFKTNEKVAEITVKNRKLH